MDRKWQIKLVLLLTLLGVIGIFAIIPYELSSIMNTAFDQVDSTGVSAGFIVMVNSLIQSGFLFILVLFGVRFQKRTGLKAPLLEGLVYEGHLPKLSKKWLVRGIGMSFILVLIVLLLEAFFFAPSLDIDTQAASPVWWQGILASLYGGITEELMLRLFIMTFIVWLFAKLTKKEQGSIPNAYYYIAIFLSTLLFGLGHLPATIQIFGELTPLLLVRTLILNGLLSLWFGYLYFRKGLEYAMIAHFSADIFIHVIFPAIVSLG